MGTCPVAAVRFILGLRPRYPETLASAYSKCSGYQCSAYLSAEVKQYATTYCTVYPRCLNLYAHLAWIEDLRVAGIHLEILSQPQCQYFFPILQPSKLTEALLSLHYNIFLCKRLVQTHKSLFVICSSLEGQEFLLYPMVRSYFCSQHN